MKDIKDYLHLYLGCECRCYSTWDADGWKDTVTPDLLITVDDEDSDIGGLHLVLRPLQDMTEEEAKELATIYTGYHINWIRIKDGQIIFNYYVGDEIQENVLDVDYLNAEGFLFLLSKGFDLFGLIKEGLAINSVQEPRKDEKK